MSNDDLRVDDLTENVLREWETLASNVCQTSTDRKVIALCRAVSSLRAEVEEARRKHLDACPLAQSVAQDTIAALRAEVERLRGALREMIEEFEGLGYINPKVVEVFQIAPSRMRRSAILDCARAALEGKP